jgi:hypothetical protein
MFTAENSSPSTKLLHITSKSKLLLLLLLLLYYIIGWQFW